jgi:uncharacterized protein DUF748
MYNTRFVRPLKILGVLYLAYLALILLVLTPALNVAAPKIYRAQTGRELRLEKIIWLNPFTLAVNVRGASSDNTDRSRFWSFDKLYANLSLSSLWRGQLVLDAVQLHGLYLQIDQLSAERYNFSDIIDHQAQRAAKQAQPAEAPNQSGGDIFPLSIDKIELNAAHLGLRAPHLSEPLAAEINNTTINIDHFSTVAEHKSTASSAANKTVNSKPSIHSGPIAVAIGYIKADLLREQQPFAVQIDNLQFALENFSSAARADQNYKLNAKFHDGGELHTQGKFDLAARRNTGEVHLRNINLLPVWRYLAPKLAFETQSGALDADIPYDVSWGEALRYSIANGRAVLRSAQLQSLRDADTKLGFAALGAEGINVDSAQPRAQIAKIALDGLAVKGWNKDTQISLLEMFEFAGSDEPSEGPPWQIQIDEVATSNGQLQWRASQLDIAELVATPLELHATNIHWPATDAAQFNFKTALNTDTQIALQGALNPADLTGKLSGEIAGLPLRWGNRLLGEQMRATLQSGSASAHFELAIDKGKPTTLFSDGRVDELEMQRLPDQQKLLAWKQLQWKKLALNLSAQTLKIDQISAVRPWLQFRLNGDGTNNFQQLTIEQTKTPALKTTVKPAPARTTKAAEKPWSFAVRNIHTENGTLDFHDNSLPRAFHTTIADFTGDLDGLSNRPGALAKVGFKGTVDGYAPVAVTGTVNPFAEAPALNIALDITNLDLAALTPYSGIYAGYTINGGRLSVQLAYTLENKRVKGTNHIVVNQLELGEQVKGPKVMDLPLRFAIYLLTDANGVMDLGVDVTGNVDDPDFSVASIIWKAFRNVIVKTATSPFRALGKLVGSSGEDLDRIEFAAGSDQIAATSVAKLNSLAEALQKKTELRLNISGHVSPWQDIEALRDNSLSQQLIAQDRITAADIQQQSKNWQNAVAKLYGKRFPADKSGKLETMQMNDAMRDNIELDPRALDELAARRALAVKQALVTERGLAADRATLMPVDLGADKTPGLQATLTLE